MSKELTPLEALKKLYRELAEGDTTNVEGFDYSKANEYLHIVETALKELNDYRKVFEKLNLDISDSADLENWIRLAQFHYENKNKKLKALDVIVKKNVDISYFKYHCIFLDDYNETIANGIGIEYLTQEEYDLLKEVLL